MYQLPLAEFIGARNQLVAALRKRDRTAAQEVKKLVKPSVSAWAVNRAYWVGRAEFDALLDASDKLRALQKQALSGDVQTGDLQAAMLAQRVALNAVSKRAEAALTEGGHGVTTTTIRRITTTLEALATYGRHESAPHPGRLVADVPAPGFEALAALAGTLAETSPNHRRKSVRSGTKRTPSRTATARKSANDNWPIDADEDQTDSARWKTLARRRIRSGRRRETGPAARRDIERKTDQAAERAAREQAQRQAQLAVDEARAVLTSRERAMKDATSAEKSALDRVYAAEKNIAAVQRELARMIDVRDRALHSAEQSKDSTEQARAEVCEAQKILDAARRALTDLE